MGFRLPPRAMTLNDLERQNRGFCGFFDDFGLRHNSIAFARCRHAINSLCNADGDFGICILTWREHHSGQWAFIHALLSRIPLALARFSYCLRNSYCAFSKMHIFSNIQKL